MPMNERRRRRAATPVVPEPKNGSSTRSPALEAASSTRVSSASGFCVGWALRPVSSFSRSAPEQIGRNQSERTWQVLVAGLERLVIERIGLGVGAPRRPDHRLVGVGEAAAAEIRHRIGFAPDDVVEDPEAEILENGADAEDVVIGADDDDGRGGLHHPPDGGEPGARERVIFGEIGELVPGVVDRVDQALVGARQRAFELQVIGRIGEHEIDRGLGEPHHLGHAVADQDRIARGRAPVAERPNDCGRAFRLAAASTRNLKLGGEAERSGARATHEHKPLDAIAGSFEPARRLCSILSKGPVMRPPMPLCRFRTA